MKNFILLLIFIINSFILVHGQVRIKMKNENGIYTTPCTVNGLKLRFIFDTGASNVSISLSEAVFMLKNGYLKEEDLKGASYSQLANGEIVSNTTVILKELEIGGIILQNVEAIIIHNISAPLLLGQSAIQKLGRLQIEGDEILIMTELSNNQTDLCEQAKSLLISANQNYFDKLNNLAFSQFKDAIALCPKSFNCFDYELFGSTAFYSKHYEDAIKYLIIASKCCENNESLYFIYLNLGDAYYDIKDFENALVCAEKSITFTQENDKIAYAYFSIALIKSAQGNYHEAIQNYEKSATYRLKYLSVSIEDVKDGNVQDVVLGETLYNTYYTYAKDNLDPPDAFLALSAICGYDYAKIKCKSYGIDYKSYIRK